jgi:hypothetical protein
MNIRSLNFFFKQLKTLMSNIDSKFSKVAITEYLLKPHHYDIYDIEGYQHKGITRVDKAGGGISIYINDDLSYKIREDLTVMGENMETLKIELEKNCIISDKNYLIGVFYRKPGSDP